MTVLVCGGRAYVWSRALNEALDVIHREKNITRIIHGAGRGADSLAVAWAQSMGIPVLAFPADWDNYGKTAGPIRNRRMLREGCPELVVAFPGGKGTANMVKLARAKGIPVIEPAKGIPLSGFAGAVATQDWGQL